MLAGFGTGASRVGVGAETPEWQAPAMLARSPTPLAVNSNTRWHDPAMCSEYQVKTCAARPRGGTEGSLASAGAVAAQRQAGYAALSMVLASALHAQLPEGVPLVGQVAFRNRQTNQLGVASSEV